MPDTPPSAEKLPLGADDGPKGKRRQAAGVSALALASGKTFAAAAGKAGIGERTLYRWAKHPVFKRRVAELRGRLVSEAVGKLSDGMATAATVMKKLLKNRDPDIRFKASKAIMELTTKLRATEELEQRIADLERQAAGRDK
jgi:hypothetical protein